MRNAICHRGEERQWKKKVNKNTYDLSSIKHLVMQNNGKEMYKKRVLRVQTCFFSN